MGLWIKKQIKLVKLLDFFQLAWLGVRKLWPDIHLLPFFFYYKYVIFWKQSLRRYICYLCKLLKWARSESIHVFSKNMLFSTTNNFLVLQMPWSIIKELIWRGIFFFVFCFGFVLFFLQFHFWNQIYLLQTVYVAPGEDVYM